MHYIYVEIAENHKFYTASINNWRTINTRRRVIAKQMAISLRRFLTNTGKYRTIYKAYIGFVRQIRVKCVDVSNMYGTANTSDVKRFTSSMCVYKPWNGSVVVGETCIDRTDHWTLQRERLCTKSFIQACALKLLTLLDLNFNFEPYWIIGDRKIQNLGYLLTCK